MNFRIKNTNILHNGTVRKEGEIIELDELQAKKLEGFVEPIKEKIPAKQTTEKTNKTKTENKKTEVKTEGKDKNGGESNGK